MNRFFVFLLLAFAFFLSFNSVKARLSVNINGSFRIPLSEEIPINSCGKQFVIEPTHPQHRQICYDMIGLGPLPWTSPEPLLFPNGFYYSKGSGFRVWAPHADQVYINGSNTKSNFLPLASEKGGFWFINVGNTVPGDNYTYIISYQGQNFTRLDPMAREIIMNGENGFLCSVVHNAEFDWGIDTYSFPGHYDIVIYEMQIPSFDPSTPGGVATFQSVIKQLDYLQELGVNIIEPIPVSTYTGDPRGWGYNPAAPYSIMPAFGGITGLKQFVQACHQRKIGVFLDIVWNHIGVPNILSVYDGWSETQPGFPTDGGPPQGIYFYQDANANTEWGPRPNFADPTVREYIVESVMMAIQECRISGFRWDSTICIRKGGTECWLETSDNLDGIHLLKLANGVTSQLGGFSVAEDLQNNATVSTPISQGGMGFDAQWDDNSYYMLQDVLVTQNDADRNFANFVQVLQDSYTGAGHGQWRVLYTENHDKASGQNAGQGRWPNQVDSSQPTSYIAQKLSTLGIATVLLSPAVPLLFYGQEYLDNENFVFGDVPDFDWSMVGEFSASGWQSVGPLNGIFNLTRDLISVRKNVQGLNTTQINLYYQSSSDLVVSFTRGQNQSTIVVMNIKSTSYQNGYWVGCPSSSNWYIKFLSDLNSYSSDFGDVGAGTQFLTPVAQPLHGFNFRINVPLGAYSTVVLSTQPN